MKPLYIFDLDGTLALIDHRRHFVERERGKQDWKAFYAACDKDEPNDPVIKTLKALRKSSEVWVWSGRSDEVKDKTVQWLNKHGIFHPFWNPLKAPSQLMMRRENDFTPDDQLKSGWLADLEPPERNRLTAVFDDRQKVVDMYRRSGVSCFQVAPGEF